MSDDPTRALVVRSALAVAIEVPAILLAREPGMVGKFGLVLALAAVLSPRFGRGALPGKLVAAAIHLVGLLATLGIVMLAEPVRPPLGLLICLGFLGLSVPRLWFALTVRSRTLVLALGLIALMGLARAAERTTFGLAVALYLLAALVSSLRADTTWPRFSRHVRGLLWPFVAALLIAGGVMAGLAWALPAAEPAVSRALAPYLEGDEAYAGLGLGDIRLGKIAQINQSDRLVMRVHGDADYLRGQVYVDYIWGRWRRRAQDVGSERESVDGAIRFDDRAPRRSVRIESEPGAALALFAPLDASRLESGPDGTRLDEFGIVQVPQELRSEPLVWGLGLADGPPRHVVEPSAHDLKLPRTLEADWAALATTWAGDAATPRARVSAWIARFHREFRYSLQLPVAPDRADPVLHFAREARFGHCEYFASALVLLARASGIPARMVAGYRVFEKTGNGWTIVRDRDAHAWAELWLDGRWQTVEPTPPGALAGENLPPPGWLAAKWDAFKRWLRIAVEWLGDLTAQALVLIGVAVVALIGLLVWLRRRRPTPKPVAQGGFAPLLRLEAWLAARGVERAPHETLRRFAESARRAGHPDAARLVDGCARWIYAERGDPAALAAAIEELTHS